MHLVESSSWSCDSRRILCIVGVFVGGGMAGLIIG